MKKRKLGNSGLESAPLAFGANVFGWTVDDSTAFQLLDAFVGAGFNLIDTADTYSRWAPGNKGGESETVIGKWFKRSGKRDQVVLATKVGMEMGDGQKGLSKSYILREAEESLRRLQTDRIDLYQSHKDDPGTHQEETLEAYAQLVKAGKVRAIGASNFGPQRLLEALEISRQASIPSYQCLQPLYNLYDREDFEKRLEPFCSENRIGVIPYYSLAKGFLSGKYRSEADLSKSPRGPGAKGYLNERGFRILAALDQTSEQLGSTPAAVSLAWLLTRPAVTAPIASATSLGQLIECMEGVKLQLDAPALEQLNQASAY
jgi:aryl-alcohol dehydrogenase-like predicted oxidoreductase